MLIVTFLFIIYLLPTWVAAARNHHQLAAIIVLNLLLGWSGLGWIIALIWSCTAVQLHRRSYK
jgi:hypothetical protein